MCFFKNKKSYCQKDGIVLDYSLFCKMNSDKILIHPSAVIDDGAVLGNGTKIWHFCHLVSTCVIGENCVLGQNVFVGNRVSIGNGVKIQNNVSLYEGIIIEENVFVGPSVVFTNVTNPRSFIERKNEFKKTSIKKGATIGANATIICGIEIGSFAMIGAGAVVTKNIKPFALIVGNPAKQIGWVSEAGIRLLFDEDTIAVCTETGTQYKLNNDIVVKL